MWLFSRAEQVCSCLTKNRLILLLAFRLLSGILESQGVQAAMSYPKFGEFVRVLRIKHMGCLKVIW